jgi:hypothetical protein
MLKRKMKNIVEYMDFFLSVSFSENRRNTTAASDTRKVFVQTIACSGSKRKVSSERKVYRDTGYAGKMLPDAR